MKNPPHWMSHYLIRALWQSKVCNSNNNSFVHLVWSLLWGYGKVNQTLNHLQYEFVHMLTKYKQRHNVCDNIHAVVSLAIKATSSIIPHSWTRAWNHEILNKYTGQLLQLNYNVLTHTMQHCIHRENEYRYTD